MYAIAAAPYPLGSAGATYFTRRVRSDMLSAASDSKVMSEPVDVPEPRVLIGTPAYRSQIDLDYLHSVMDFFRSGIRFSLLTIGNESLITRARNTIVSAFYHSTSFTHLFFLDADVGIEGASLRRLLEHRRDVIGAPVPLKTLREGGERIYNYNRVIEAGSDGVLRVKFLGTAAMLLSRAAVERLVEAAKARGDVYELRNDDVKAPSGQPPQYDVFKVGVQDGDYLSEDFWICQSLRDLGVEIYVDPTIRTRHSGPHRF